MSKYRELARRVFQHLSQRVWLVFITNLTCYSSKEIVKIDNDFFAVLFCCLTLEKNQRWRTACKLCANCAFHLFSTIARRKVLLLVI